MSPNLRVDFRVRTGDEAYLRVERHGVGKAVARELGRHGREQTCGHRKLAESGVVETRLDACC